MTDDFSAWETEFSSEVRCESRYMPTRFERKQCVLNAGHRGVHADDPWGPGLVWCDSEEWSAQ